MNLNKRIIRTAGILYLVIALCGPFSMMYVPSTLIVSGDAEATALNISSSMSLFRASLASDSIIFLSEIVLVALLYILLKPVNRPLALGAVFSRLAMAVVQGINLFNHIIPLLLLDNPEYLAAFTPEQMHSLSMLFLEAHQNGVYIWQLFFGLHLPLLGYLVFKSGNVPRAAGILMMVGSAGYLLDSYTNLLSVSIPALTLLASIGLAAATIGELWFTFWLLVKGGKNNSMAVSTAS